MVVLTSLWPEQFLNGPDVVAIFQKMRGEAMAHGVQASWL
jgi:hypothetical protein